MPSRTVIFRHKGRDITKTFHGAHLGQGPTVEDKINDFVQTLAADNISDAASAFNKNYDAIVARVTASAHPWMIRYIHNMLPEHMLDDTTIDEWVRTHANSFPFAKRSLR